MKHFSSGVAVSWISRKYKKVNGAIQYQAGHEGDWRYITNPMVWEDENIAEGTNWNVVTDGGRQLLAYNLLGVGATGFALYMAMGSGSTPADHLQDRLVYELIADGTRPLVTNENASALSAATVTLTGYTDDDYDPPYPYYVQAIVRADIDGDTTLNVGASVREVGLNTVAACPGTPTGLSGVLWNRYVYPSSTPLDPGTLLIVLGFLHF
jgi:hypothetical protein